MRRTRSAWVCSVLFTLLGAAPTRAEVHAEVGTRFGVLSIPFGNAVGGEPIGRTTSPVVPLELEIGLRSSPTLFLGLFGRLGLAISNSPHDPECYLCVGHVTMFGVEALFHLAPAASPDPWIGLALGLELPGDIYKSGASPDEPYQRRMWGPMLEVQSGFDWPLGEHVALGPWVALAIGAYTSRSQFLEEQKGAEIPDPYSTAVHFWVSAGLRVSVRF
jgi:hypothetical protein